MAAGLAMRESCGYVLKAVREYSANLNEFYQLTNRHRSTILLPVAACTCAPNKVSQMLTHTALTLSTTVVVSEKHPHARCVAEVPTA